MLRIKLQQGSKENTAYRIKINHETIDQGILVDEVEFLEYKGIDFKNSNNDVVSISCTNFLAGREIYIKAIEIDNTSIIAGDNFKYETIVSGCCEDIQQVIDGNYSDVVNMDRAGSVGHWIFKVSSNEEKSPRPGFSEPDSVLICFWNDNEKEFTPCLLDPTRQQVLDKERAECQRILDIERADHQKKLNEEIAEFKIAVDDWNKNDNDPALERAKVVWNEMWAWRGMGMDARFFGPDGVSQKLNDGRGEESISYKGIDKPIIKEGDNQ